MRTVSISHEAACAYAWSTWAYYHDSTKASNVQVNHSMDGGLRPISVCYKSVYLEMRLDLLQQKGTEGNGSDGGGPFTFPTRSRN
jgi:hypothetical protein